MPKYQLTATITGSKYLGKVEAENVDEAMRKGYELDNCRFSPCDECANECEDAKVVAIHASLDEE